MVESDFNERENIVRRYITKGKIGIYFELSEHTFNVVQEKLIKMYLYDKQIKFIK